MQERFLITVVFCTLLITAVAQPIPTLVLPGEKTSKSNLTKPVFPSLQELVKKNAPKVYLHSKEKYKMSSISWYLRRVHKEERVTDLNSLSGAEILSNANGDTFKLLSEDVNHNNITDDNLHPNNEDIVLSHKSKRVGYGNQFSAKCYVHVRPSYYQDILPILVHEIDIQYHFFYPFNGTALHHEGDWESIIVKVSPDGTVRKIGLSAHGDIKWYNPDQLDYQNTHPIVYAANKSHAFYESKGHFVPAVFTSPDVTNKGRVFRSWHHYEIVAINDSILDASGNQPIQNNGIEAKNNNWLNYTGKWGKKGANVDIGVLGVHEDSKGSVSPKTNTDYWSGKDTNRDQGYITKHLFGQYPASLTSGPDSISSNGYSTYAINLLPSNTKILSWKVESVDSTKTANDIVFNQFASNDSSISLKAKPLSLGGDIKIIATILSDYGSYKVLDKVIRRVPVISPTTE